MEFTAKDVAKLREQTGAGFADCRTAHASSYEEAVKLIEQKGQARAEKVKSQDRETREGRRIIYPPRRQSGRAAGVELQHRFRGA